MPNPEFWRGKKVLLTGHTGFKGAWLALLLAAFGAQVTGFALAPNTHPNLSLAARLARRLRSIEGDVRELGAIERAVRAARPEIVLHLAALPIVRSSYSDPAATFATNVLGTVNVLEAVRRAGGVRAVLVVTSDKCYENREWLWSYREKSSLGGRDPYSASKACAELVTRSYRDSFFAAGNETFLASARAGNVIGGGDWAPDRLVPDVVRALTEGREVTLRYPNAIRPWQHVLDVSRGYLLLVERLYSGGEPFAEAWNFAPGEDDARTVGWIAERLQEAWGVPSRWQPETRPQPHEHTFLKLDASKARALLGWRPRLAIEVTIDWTIDWYRRFYAGESAETLVAEQLDQFHALVAANEAVGLA